MKDKEKITTREFIELKNTLVIGDESRGRIIELHSSESIGKLINYAHHIQENFFNNNKSHPGNNGIG